MSAERSEPYSGMNELETPTKALMPEHGSDGSEGSETSAVKGEWIIRIRNVNRDGAPPDVRLRRLLKVLLRTMGMRCLGIRETDQPWPWDGQETAERQNDR